MRPDAAGPGHEVRHFYGARSRVFVRQDHSLPSALRSVSPTHAASDGTRAADLAGADRGADRARAERALPAGHPALEASFGTVTITGCNIFNNAGNGVYEISRDLTVNAQDNRWRDPVGPAGPAGDGVSGEVDASNPLAAAVTLGY
jgi:hypothetical protein